MSNAITRNNKEARRARIAAAKKERNAAGKNMFNSEVKVKIPGLMNAPSSTNAEYETTVLRPSNTFTGKPFNRKLNQISRVALSPASSSIVTREDAELNKGTRTANKWGETGNGYLRPRKPNSAERIRNHRTNTIAATRNIKGVKELKQRARALRNFADNSEGAKRLNEEADRLRKETPYIVAEPTEVSLNNAKNAQLFAEGIHAKQRKPESQSMFASCLGGKCNRAVNGTRLGGRRKRRCTRRSTRRRKN